MYFFFSSKNHATLPSQNDVSEMGHGGLIGATPVKKKIAASEVVMLLIKSNGQ